MAFKSTRQSRRLKNNRSEDQQKNQPFFSKASDTVQTKQENAFFQPKLTIGQPNDKYEKEADSMADAVVNQSSQQSGIQQKEISNIQRTTLSTPVEDEKLGTAEERMKKDKLIQEKPEIQRMENEEEENVQMKSESGSANTASSQVSQKINSKAGRGQKLTPKVQAEMESGIGADFSQVNVHTDSDAAQMNKELGAQAFTHGNDIYFNSGKYNAESSNGKRLLAHELVHVVQQGRGHSKNKIRKKRITKTNKPTIQRGALDSMNWMANKVSSGVSNAYSGTKKIGKYAYTGAKRAGKSAISGAKGIGDFAINNNPVTLAYRFYKYLKRAKEKIRKAWSFISGKKALYYPDRPWNTIRRKGKEISDLNKITPFNIGGLNALGENTSSRKGVFITGSAVVLGGWLAAILSAAGTAAATIVGLPWATILLIVAIILAIILLIVLIVEAILEAETSVCMGPMEACLSNPWQPAWNKGDFGPRKDCGACFRQCNHSGGAWPYDKCPL